MLVSVAALTLWSVLVLVMLLMLLMSVLMMLLLMLLIVLLLGSGSLLGAALLLVMHPFTSPFSWVKSHLSLRLFCFSYFSIQNYLGWEYLLIPSMARLKIRAPPFPSHAEYMGDPTSLSAACLATASRSLSELTTAGGGLLRLWK